MVPGRVRTAALCSTLLERRPHQPAPFAMQQVLVRVQAGPLVPEPVVPQAVEEQEQRPGALAPAPVVLPALALVLLLEPAERLARAPAVQAAQASASEPRRPASVPPVLDSARDSARRVPTPSVEAQPLEDRHPCRSPPARWW
jgi:hypothetical protein